MFLFVTKSSKMLQFALASYNLLQFCQRRYNLLQFALADHNLLQSASSRASIRAFFVSQGTSRGLIFHCTKAIVKQFLIKKGISRILRRRERTPKSVYVWRPTSLGGTMCDRSDACKASVLFAQLHFQRCHSMYWQSSRRCFLSLVDSNDFCRGTAFLSHQVRCIMGVLVLVGRELEDLSRWWLVRSRKDSSQKPQYKPFLKCGSWFEGMNFNSLFSGPFGLWERITDKMSSRLIALTFH